MYGFIGVVVGGFLLDQCNARLALRSLTFRPARNHDSRADASCESRGLQDTKCFSHGGAAGAQLFGPHQLCWKTFSLLDFSRKDLLTENAGDLLIPGMGDVPLTISGAPAHGNPSSH